MSLTASVARVLAGQLAAELERVRREVAELERLAGAAGDSEPDPVALWAIAGHLQAYYSGIEAMLLRVLKEVDGVVPSGADSHQEVLRQASIAVPDIRPAVLDDETVESLGPYLAFRHFFRHAYGVTLRWERMGEKVRRARAVLGLLEGRLAAFRDFLGRVSGAG